MGFLSDRIKTYENGREVIQMKDSVNFLIATRDGYVALAEQVRLAVSGVPTLNVFGGYVEDGEDYDIALKRELFEESNITEDDIDIIEMIYRNKYVSMGYTTEKNSLGIVWLNKCKDELTFKCNDTEEGINIKLFPIENFVKMNCEGLKTDLTRVRMIEYYGYMV